MHVLAGDKIQIPAPFRGTVYLRPYPFLSILSGIKSPRILFYFPSTAPAFFAHLCLPLLLSPSISPSYVTFRPSFHPRHMPRAPVFVDRKWNWCSAMTSMIQERRRTKGKRERRLRIRARSPPVYTHIAKSSLLQAKNTINPREVMSANKDAGAGRLNGKIRLSSSVLLPCHYLGTEYAGRRACTTLREGQQPPRRRLRCRRVAFID